MTSWRGTTHFLILFTLVTHIGLSEGDCHNYFKLKNWKRYFNNSDVVHLVKTKDDKNTIKCTLEKLSSCTKLKLSHILRDCFKDQSKNYTCPTECMMTEDELIVPLDDFMCLTAEAIEYKAPECTYYNSVCKYLSGGQTNVSDQKTIPTPVQERPRTITTPIQERTTTITPIQERTTTITPIQERTTTPTLPEITPTLQSTTINATANPDGTIEAQARSAHNSTVAWRSSFLFSLFVNVALLLVCIYMCMQRRRSTPHVLPDANGSIPDSETLLQPVSCHSATNLSLEIPIRNGEPH